MVRQVVVLCVCAIAGLSLIAVLGAQLGHDEAVYALGGQGLLGPAPLPYPAYRPDAMPLVASVGVLLGGSDLAMRALPILLSAGLVALVAAMARSIQLDSAVAFVVLASFVVLRRGAQLGSDIPAALLTLALIEIVHVSTLRGRWWLLATSPVAAAAFYLRYGTLVVLAAVALAFAIVWRDRLRPYVVPALAAASLFTALLIPHALDSLAKTGHVYGLFLQAGEESSRRYLGEGLVYYISRWWWSGVGPATTVLLVTGIVASVRTRDRHLQLWGLSAALVTLGFGITTHGEGRFVLVPMILWTLVGAHAIGFTWSSRWRTTGALLIAISAIVGATLAITARSADGPAAAGHVIARSNDASPRPCLVIASRRPQVAWYSQCTTVEPAAHDTTLRATYLVELSADRLPPSLAALRDRSPSMMFGPRASVYRILHDLR